MSDSPRKSLRILLSAYACGPGNGSEPGVGWGWALALARRGRAVWVLPRRNNPAPIEPEYRRLEPALITLGAVSAQGASTWVSSFIQIWARYWSAPDSLL